MIDPNEKCIQMHTCCSGTEVTRERKERKRE
jgi:hypothetical protein